MIYWRRNRPAVCYPPYVTDTFSAPVVASTQTLFTKKARRDDRLSCTG
ncbi:MAG: hypothetical protein LBQ66_03975 [Planctomycetaceae bacterium]|nr:hypothetical protein [Planctomycetaceae bacterium]